MLIGNFISKLATNGRTAMPKKFRTQLGDNLVLLQGYEHCLMLVPASALDQLTPGNQPLALSAARNTERFLLGNAFEVSPDSQGRFVIPTQLRDYASLQSEEVIFVGVGNRIELWSPEKWQEYQEYLADNSAEIAESLVQNS